MTPSTTIISGIKVHVRFSLKQDEDGVGKFVNLIEITLRLEI